MRFLSCRLLRLAYTYLSPWRNPAFSGVGISAHMLRYFRVDGLIASSDSTSRRRRSGQRRREMAGSGDEIRVAGNFIL